MQEKQAQSAGACAARRAGGRPYSRLVPDPKKLLFEVMLEVVLCGWSVLLFSCEDRHSDRHHYWYLLWVTMCPPKSYGEVLTPSTFKCDLIRK